MSYPPPYPGGYPPQQGYQMPQPELGFSFPDQAPSQQSSFCPYPSNQGFPTAQPQTAPTSYGAYPSQPSYQANQSAYPAPYSSAQSQISPSAFGAYPSQPSYQTNQTPYPGTQPGLYPSGQPSPYASGPQPGPYPSSAAHSAPAGYPALNDFQSPSYPASSPYPNPSAKVAPPRPSQQPVKRNMEHGVPTLTPYGAFNATADAEGLRKAMKGFGTDEKAIIQVLAKRTADQRMDILRSYKANFGKDLIKDLKGELSGNFERLVLALMHPRMEYLATEVYEAIKGLGTEEGTLVEILAPRSNHEIREIAAAYMRLYGKSMEEAVASDTSGEFKRLLIAISQGLRDENFAVDMQEVQNDAHKLYSAGEGRLGTDESTFIQILATKSYPHLRQLQIEYMNITGHALEDAVKREFSGNVEKGLVAILITARSPAEYFANRIRNAISGAGTHDRALIRCIVSRCEVDLFTVKEHYARIYGTSMVDAIAGDTSGDYKKLLLALCGN